MLTAVFLSSPDAADTVHRAEMYMRPPWPYDPVASKTKLEQSPSVAGAVIITSGATGFSGESITTLLKAVGFDAQTRTPSLQNALSFELRTVSVSPTLMKFTLLEASVTTGKDAFTVAAFTHVHVILEASEKVKRVLHAQATLVLPASSVGASNLIRKKSPLSANCDEMIVGAGKADILDSSWTVVEGLV